MTTPSSLGPTTYENIPSTGIPIQCAPAGSGSFNVYNGDIANVLLVAPSTNVGLTNSIPVQPLTNATMTTGNNAWYMLAATGTVATATVSGSAQISPSPAQIAAQIAALGLATASNQDLQLAQETATATNTGEIETNTASIETSSANTATNTNAISNNTGTIAGNTTAIESSSAGIQTNTGTIVTNTGNTANSSATTATNTSSISTNAALTTNYLAGNLTGPLTSTATNTGTIETNTGEIATSSSQIATNTNTVATNTGTIANNTTSIESSSNQIETNTGSIVTNTSNTVNEVVNVNTTLGTPAQTVDVTTTLVNNLGGPGGVGINHLITYVGSNTAMAVTSGNTVVQACTFSKPAYIITLWADFTSSTGTTPFVLANMAWFDSARNVITAEETWIIPVTPYSATPLYYPIFGKGPVKGNELQLAIYNFSTEEVTVYNYIYEASFPITRDDWRGSQIDVAGYTSPQYSDMRYLILASGTTTIAASGQLELILPLYAGQVIVTVENATSLSTVVEIAILNPNTSAFSIMDVASSAQYITSLPVSLPRCPCLLEIFNQGAESGTYTYTVIGQEYAS